MIIGAGVTGLETAEYLCHEGNAVVLVDMLDKVAPNVNHTNVADVCGRLKKYNARFMMSHALKEIKEDGVILERLIDKENVEIPADAVVLSLGFRPDNHLVEELKQKDIKWKFQVQTTRLLNQLMKIMFLITSVKSQKYL